MTTHDHAAIVPGCFRCEVGADETNPAFDWPRRQTIDSDRCASTRLDGTRCDRSAGHDGAHIHETANGIYGWGNTA